MSDINLYTPSDRSDLEALVRAQRLTYLNTPDTWEAWIDWVPKDNMRAVRRGDKVIGGIMLVPMGQWFGGRSVSMTGISAVGIEPAERASGAGAVAMRLVLEELRDAGVAFSTLWPATMTVYRRVGYEFAGHNLRYVLSADDIDVRDRSLRIEQCDEQDAAKAVYATYAKRTNGLVDRSDYYWDWRVSAMWGHEVDTYLVHGDDGPEGFVAYYRQPGNAFPGRASIHANLVALTPAAVRRILTFFADHRSFNDEVHWMGPPDDGFSMHLSEPRRALRNSVPWMSRIVHVEHALTQRGYLPGLTAELHVHIRDDVLPANDGAYVVQVRDGAATVERGGRGDVSIDVRGLAPLFTSYRSASELLTTGYVDGSAEALRTADAVFAGPAPWTADSF